MNLEDFHCDMFDVSFPISEEDFNKDAFFKAMAVENESEYVDEDGDLSLSISFASREDTSKQHAHIRISLYSNKAGAVSINYHHTGIKTPDRKPPYLEDCAQWFGGVVKRNKIAGTVSVAYDFEEGFTTTIPLPFPLVASHEALTGLKVTGLSFQYPDDAPIESAIVQREEKKIFLFFHKKAVINLKEFDLFKELEALTPTVETLVRRHEKTNGSKKKTKARKTS